VQPGFGHTDASRHHPPRKIDFPLIIGVLLLLPAILFTLLTIDGLSSRRRLRMELAEISHVRYGLLNADRWREIIAPILAARIDTLDLTAQDRVSLRPTVEKALYRLLDDIKEQMSARDSQSAGIGGFLGQGNAVMVNLIVGALRPHVPEYADVVLAELGKPENQQAFKEYIRGFLAEGIRDTFGNVDMKRYSYILKQHGCVDATTCQQELGNRIREADARIASFYLTVLVSSAVAFVLLLTAKPVLQKSGVVLLLLFCVVLLAGAVFTPMIEVEAKISRLGLMVLGKPVAFQDQLLYFQSKSVLEVFQTLITTGRLDMWFVGVLVLMFSIVFPTLKVFTLGFCLHKPALLRENRVVRFLALDSSKWSMADVMALAIFMSFVAFNGLIASTVDGLREIGGELVIPTDSSKILPGYYLFIGFCLASLFLSKKLERGIKTAHDTEQN
jgi:Paraquat-inducible protein A